MVNKGFITLIIIYIFFLLLNHISPMAFGDDYLYSFIWQGKPMYMPISEDAVRISSWHDLFASQWSHYLTWSGRTVNHTIAQFFLWMGKRVFNIFNALVSTLLIVEIYYAIHKGEITLDFNSKKISIIFFALWAFTPGFVSVFCWLDGACNYLWTNTIILGFLLPYIHKYYHFEENVKHGYLISISMFFWGLIAGWTNENSICWLILVLAIFVFTHRKVLGMEKWLYAGFFGLVTGYSLLMFAPGNAVRLYAEHGDSVWLTKTLLRENAEMLFAVLCMYQLLLWYFCLRSLFSLRQFKIDSIEVQKDIEFARIACILSICMTGVMFFSPFFPPRSAFAGTIFIIIASGVLINIQSHYKIQLVNEGAKRFLSNVAIFYFIMTSTVTFYHTQKINTQMQELITTTKKAANAGGQDILITRPFDETKRIFALMSGFHIPGFELSKDENNWANVAFARYYGIKGIRMVKETNEDKNIDNQSNSAKNSTSQVTPLYH